MLTCSSDPSPTGLDDDGTEKVNARENAVAAMDVPRGIARDQLELDIIERRSLCHLRGLAPEMLAVARIFRINAVDMIQPVDKLPGTTPTPEDKATPRRSLPEIACSHWGASAGAAGGPALDERRIGGNFKADGVSSLPCLCRIYWPTRPIPFEHKRI